MILGEGFVHIDDYTIEPYIIFDKDRAWGTLTDGQARFPSEPTALAWRIKDSAMAVRVL